MPVPSTVEQFLEVGVRSGILDRSAVADFREKAGTPKELARWLVVQGHLTSFQAQQLLQGKWRGFLIAERYRALEQLGAGGMGNVFLREHLMMHRLVALKVLPTQQAKDPALVERFHRETRVASLAHPNIVRAYDIGHDEGLHFLVMEYVDGSSLQQIVEAGGRMDLRRACHYIAQSALGLQHAHESGVVHRDIKPANILVDRNGIVKILDMGLVRFFYDDKDNLTRRTDSSAVLGTADYIAPEQAIDSHTADIRADIYSLGVTFYFLLAGHAPFDGGSKAQKLLWSQTREPRPILEVRPEVPAPLADVIARMMAKKLDARYQVPSEIDEALAPWLQEPIGPPPAAEMPRRCPAVLRIERSSVKAEPMPAITPLPRLLPARPASASSATPKPRTPAAGSFKQARAALPAAKINPPNPRSTRPFTKRSWIWWAAGIAGVVLAAALLFALLGGKGSSRAEPSGSTESGLPPAKVEVLQAHRDLAVSAHDLDQVAVSPWGDFAVSAGPDNFLAIWDIREGREDQRLTATDFDQRASSTAVTPDNQRVIAGCRGGLLRAFDVGRKMHLWAIDSKQQHIHDLALSGDGKRAVTAGEDHTVALWMLEKPALVGAWKGHAGPVIRVDFNSNGTRALSAGREKLVCWEAPAGRPLNAWSHRCTAPVTALAFTPGGAAAWVSSADGSVRLWDVGLGTELKRLSDHPGAVRAMRLTPDGRYLITACTDDRLRIHEATTGEVVQQVAAPPSVSGLSLTAGGGLLVAVGTRTMRTWVVGSR